MRAAIGAEAIPPVLKTLTLRQSPERVFRGFTDEIGRWWPKATHSLGKEEVEDVRIEPWVGGRVYERLRNGSEASWGTVTAWDPPRLFAMTWHLGRGEESAQDLRVEFIPEGEGTRLELTHAGWERLGESGRASRDNYEGGWDYVLSVYGEKYLTSLGQ